MRRLLVNDQLSALGERTFWHLLKEWFGMEFVGGDYAGLADRVIGAGASLIIRNATWFPPIKTQVPTISLLQDIITEGSQREMQEHVIRTSDAVVFNSPFTYDKYTAPVGQGQMLKKSKAWTIPLPVDFTVFEPQNAMGCQQALALPDGCVCWIGASQGAAGHVKGWDIMQAIARHNPDLRFVCVFKDAIPDSLPPNMRAYARVSHEELVRIIGACRVGLCTSRMESQHLAGIEMGACGLPMVTPAVGCYWKRGDMPGIVWDEKRDYASCVRELLATNPDQQIIRDYWRREFDIPVVRAQWEKLVQEVECSGQS